MKLSRMLLIVTSLTVLILNGRTQDWITNGLVAYYPLDGNAYDASGHGINGVLHNVSPTTDRFGLPGAAMMFQGTNGSYVDMGAPASLQFTGDFTVTAWANFSEGTPAFPRIVSYGADCGYELLTGNTSPDRHWRANLACVKFSASPTSLAGEWQFVAVRRSGSNANIFLNGQFVVTNTVATTPKFSGDLNLGRKSIQNQLETLNYWGGAIDEVRFYNRALSFNELAQLYALESFCSPHWAQAVATLAGGGVVGATMVDYGCGYANSPSVRILGGGGSGATAIANMTDGIVTDVVITSAGTGYTNAPQVLIESPPFVPTVSIAVSKVKVTQQVRVNHRYVLETSSDLVNWTRTGPAFTAESESIVDQFNVKSVGQFFRLREVP